MNFYEVQKLNNWYFKIKLPLTDKLRVKYLMDGIKYIYSIQRYVKDKKIEYLYEDEPEEGEFRFQIGFASVIYQEFWDELSQSSKKLLEDIIFSDYKVPKIDGLYDFQQRDLEQLMSVNRGLFQCYTSYGKTVIIPRLAYQLWSEGKYVLIITSGNPALQELQVRLKDYFGIEPVYFDTNSRLNCINLNGYLKSSWYDPADPYWKHDFWILADEVENCCSETAMEFYENLGNVNHMYGFSATSDKKAAEPLYSRVPDAIMSSIQSKYEGKSNVFNNRMKMLEEIEEVKDHVRDVLGRNKYLVGYYGTSAVFKRPSNFKITMIDVSTTFSKDDVEIPDSYEYSEIIYDLYANERMSKLLESIVYKVGLTFIPMYRLEVIDYWIEHIFKKRDFLVAVVCGRGYEIYEQGNLIDTVDLESLKYMVSCGSIGVILGTRSSYGAMDLPELNRSILLYSKAANVIIQAIGRTTRSKEFEIYNIVPIKSIPIYTKDLSERKSLIQNYYRDCKIKELKFNENNYG